MSEQDSLGRKRQERNRKLLSSLAIMLGKEKNKQRRCNKRGEMMNFDWDRKWFKVCYSCEREKRCLILSPAVTTTRSLFSVSLSLLLGWLCLMEWLHSSPGKMMAKRGSLREKERERKRKREKEKEQEKLWNLRDFVAKKRSTDGIERNELFRFHCQAMREKRDKSFLLKQESFLFLCFCHHFSFFPVHLVFRQISKEEKELLLQCLNVKKRRVKWKAEKMES